MNTSSGDDDFRFAELYFQMPAHFKRDGSFELIEDWPLEWMQKIAHYPHNNNTSLGGALTIIANDDPPQPIAPGLPFTSIMLLNDDSIERLDGSVVRLYRMVPLYTAERELELAEGAPALMRAFDRKEVPYIFDRGRPNAAE